MAAIKSKVSKKVEKMLKAGVGKMFYIEGHSDTLKKNLRNLVRFPASKLRRLGDASGFYFVLDNTRFLGIDADEPDEIVWLFCCVWTEDGFPCCRIMRITDGVMAKASIEAGGKS